MRRLVALSLTGALALTAVPALAHNRRPANRTVLSFKRARAAITRSWDGADLRITRCRRDTRLKITCSDRVRVDVQLGGGPTSHAWLLNADAATLRGDRVQVTSLGSAV